MASAAAGLLQKAAGSSNTRAAALAGFSCRVPIRAQEDQMHVGSDEAGGVTVLHHGIHGPVTDHDGMHLNPGGRLELQVSDGN